MTYKDHNLVYWHLFMFFPKSSDLKALLIFCKKMIGKYLVSSLFEQYVLHTEHNPWIGSYCWQGGSKKVLYEDHAWAFEGDSRVWEGREGQKFQFNADWWLIQWKFSVPKEVGWSKSHLFHSFCCQSPFFFVLTESISLASYHLGHSYLIWPFRSCLV